MTKRDLVIQVAQQLGVTQHEVSNTIQELLDAITDSLSEGNRLEIRNFGVFELKERDARIGRNPKTGEKVPIPAKRTASFKPGKALKKWVHDGPENRPDHLFKDDIKRPTVESPLKSGETIDSTPPNANTFNE